DIFVHDIEEGMSGTSMRAGIIKLASDTATVSGELELCFRAAARAHRRTGVPITTHSESDLFGGDDQQRILAEEGVDLRRVVIGHAGDSTNLDYLKRLMERGSYIGADRLGLETVAGGRVPDADRVATIARLCQAGYAGRILLSHDRIFTAASHPTFSRLAA